MTNNNTLRFACAVIAAASLALSCQISIERLDRDVPGNGEIQTFTCVIADDAPDSKVSISDQGKTRWEVGDKILVHGEYTGEGKSLTVTLSASDISADGKTATINVAGVAPYDRLSDKGYTSTIYAAYPAGAVKDNEHCYYYSNFARTDAPLMAAYNDGKSFVFYNLCGLISYKVSGDFDSVAFSGNNGETVGYSYFRSYLVQQSSGTPRLDYNYTSDGGTNGPKTLYESSVTADGSTVNYICLPAGANFTKGFTFRFYKNGKLVKIGESAKAVNLGRNNLLRLGDISSKLRDPSAEESHNSSIDVANATNLGADGTANCYIVEDPGDYKFPAVKGNSNSSVGSVASVEILWETCCSATAPTKNSIIEAVDFEGSWICFRAPEAKKAGNALIAAKNSSGAILWSWHIWIPENTISTETYCLSASLVMDRNLGALSTASATSPLDGSCFGLLYEWGRKDPFPGAASTSGSSAAKVTGTASTLIRTPQTVAYGVANPTTFITQNNADWLSEADNSLWGSTKTIYDPCPPGYKVPSRAQATGFFTDLTGVAGWASSTADHWFKAGNPVTIFPKAGYIDDYATAASSFSNQGERAAIWSADGSAAKGYLQDVRTDSGVITSAVKSAAKSRGASVRCISETVAPFVNEAGMPIQGGYTRYVFSTSDVDELSGLCFSKDKDFMWGVGDGGYLYKIKFDMSVTTQMSKEATYETDLEGITIDPVTADLYVCTEPCKVKKIAAPNYNTIATLFEVADAANYGNNGLEGITYYKDNVIYVGSQEGATLWAYTLSGTLKWKKQLGAIAPGITEVGDLYYDPQTDLLWVSDSETRKLFVLDGAVTKLKAIYSTSDIGNPESVLVDHERSCVYVGDDGSTSKIYKYSFTNLN